MRESPEEADFKLISDDPATLSDLTAWARMTKNEVIQLDPHTFTITRGESRIKP
jgi:TusA-related sulfurtransferase